MLFEIHTGDALEVLRTLPDESVQCCVTSPPYWGLRDYGTAEWEGGDPECAHVVGGQVEDTKAQGAIVAGVRPGVDASTCRKCGARRIDQQLGLEATPEAYVAKMVEVFREVRRVLRGDGTCWLNLGDSYAGHHGNSRVPDNAAPSNKSGYVENMRQTTVGISGLKPKDLVGIPWRVARALQEPYYTGHIHNETDRAWLAAAIDGEGCLFIHKRKTGQSNGQGYVRKHDSYGAGLEVANCCEAFVQRCMDITGKGSICHQDGGRKQRIYRWNLRSNECRKIVREVYPHLVAKQHEARLLLGCPSSGPEAAEAHESLKKLHNGHPATIDFPAPEPMFEQGWFLRQDIIWSKLNPMPESVTDRCTKAHEYLFLLTKSARYYYDADAVREKTLTRERAREKFNTESAVDTKKRGWGSHCGTGSDGRNRRSVWTITAQPYPEAHFATFPEALVEPCILAGSKAGDLVLDPFCGSGTTGSVAVQLSRRFVGIELNPEYVKLAHRRIGPHAAQTRLF